MERIYKLEALLDTTYGMKTVSRSVSYIAGVDWFSYAGAAVKEIYYTNHSLGFNEYSSQQLCICEVSTHGTIINCYRQEGTLVSGDRFLKIRIEGRQDNTKADDRYLLTFEVFLIEGQKLFINVTKLATASIGKSSIYNGTRWVTLPISSKSTAPVQILIKNAGSNEQIISSENYKDVIITELEIVSMPVKTEYPQNDIFDKTGLSVNAVREDGKKFQITGFTLSGFDSTFEGTNDVTVSYAGVSASFNVIITQNRITEIALTSDKTLYKFGERFSASNAILTGTFENGESITLNPNLATYSGFSKGVPGKQTISAIYGEFSASLEISVQAPVIEDLLDTKTEMDYVLNNQARNGYVVSVDGVGWFKYGIRTANAIYVASNGWIGFGRPQEHLSLFHGNNIDKTSIYNVLRQEGILQSGKKFLKIRVEGYTYKSKDSDVAYIYEVFLIEGQTLFIYVPKLPIKSGYPYGGGDVAYVFDEYNKQYIFSIKATNNGGVQPVTVLVENAGINQHVSEEMYVDKVYTEIEIVSLPNKTTYIQGEKLDTSGMTVNAIDSDGTRIPVTNYSVEGFDSTKMGEKTLSVIYQGLKAELKITVNGKNILKVTKSPTKTAYAIGEEFNPDGLELTFYKSDGTKEIINAASYTLSSPDMSITGRQIVTAAYLDYKTLFSIDVGNNISSSSNTTPRVAFARASVNSSGKIVVNNNAREIVIPKGGSTYTYDVLAGGKELVSIHLPTTMTTIFGLKSSVSTVDISIPPSVTKITEDSLTSIPAKEMWLQNISEVKERSLSNWFMATRIYISSTVKKLGYNAFSSCYNLQMLVLPKSISTITKSALQNLTGLKRIYFMNPSLDNISLSESDGLKIYGFSDSTAETYANKNDIPFVPLGGFESLELVTEPKKTKYKIGDIFDIYGIDLRAVYSSGEKVSIPPDSITGFDSTTEGVKTVTLNYESASVTFDIKVVAATGIEITRLPVKTKYSRGEDFDEEGLIVSECYTDGTKKRIVDFMLSGYDSSVVGMQNVVATYDGKSASFPVDVSLDTAFVGIMITKLPDKITYSPGDTFSPAGLKYASVRGDGSIIGEFSSYASITKPDMGATGKQTVTITGIFGSITYATSFEIEVKETAVSIEVNERYGNTPYFFIGDENTGNFRYAVKSIKVNYEDGSSKIITSGFTETEVDTSKAGDFYTTLSYAGFEIKSPYTVYGNPFVTKTGYPDKESAILTLNTDSGDCTVEGTGALGYPAIAPSSFYDKIKTLNIEEGITGISSFRFCSITYLGIPSTVTSLTDKNLSFLSDYKNMIICLNAKKDSISGAPWGKTNATVIWAAKPEALNIVSYPTKMKYVEGDTFDPTGIQCSALYSNGKTYAIDGALSYSELDMTNAGKKTVTVSYVEDDKTVTAAFQIEVLAKVTGIRISKFPQKVFYKVGEPLDLTGLEVVTVSGLGDEKAITDYEVSGFDSSKAGSKTITVSYNTTSDGITKFIGSDSFQIKVTNDGKNPFGSSTGSSTGGGDTGETEENTEPVYVTVHWIDGEFEDLTHENGGIKANTFVLQESICSEQYFIFGGCISNQVSFETGHKQFWGTDEDSYPSGRIEVYLECNKTQIKVFTGRIASAERTSIYSTRKIIAYDYLYDLRNTDIARWYKNQTTDKKKKLTQKQFRDKLFEFIGLEQVPTKLHWDDTYVPDTNNANEMNVVNILKDLCLQNDRFGWMNRDGKFEYLKLRQNSHKTGETTTGKKIYQYYDNAEVHLDTFKSFWAKEGRIWFPHTILTDPDPNRAFGFTQGEPTAQEAYENNVFYNRNSFFVGNEDWMDYVWNADEYGGISREKPIINICYGTFVNQDLRKYYRAQAYTAEVIGNPLNTVGQTIELRNTKQMEDGTELEWYVHSYIMSRTLKLGNSQLIDTYSANNAPFNSNSRQLGKDTPEISATVNRTRSEMPVVSYEEFTDGTDEFTPAAVDDFGSNGTVKQAKKVAMRCMKRIKKEDYDKLPDAIKARKDTVFMTYKES